MQQIRKINLLSYIAPYYALVPDDFTRQGDILCTIKIESNVVNALTPWTSVTRFFQQSLPNFSSNVTKLRKFLPNVGFPNNYVK